MTEADVLANVRTWLGVPYVHQGRSREGVDCVGLVICNGWELGFLDRGFDVQGYDRQPDGTLFRRCEEMLPKADIGPCRIAVMKFASEPQHMAFLVPYPGGRLAMIHALRDNGKVVEHRLDALWQSRIVGTFGIPGIH